MKTTGRVRMNIDGHVATVQFGRAPHNYLDMEEITAIADAFAELEIDDNCRAVVLASEGKSFCAGADFSSSDSSISSDPADFYHHAMRLFDFSKPIVAAVHGAAIGAGAGLALAADFRIVSAQTRFSVNFNRLGFHPGFGVSCTLPRLVGVQKASLLLFTGRRIGGVEAGRIGLADEVVESGDVLAKSVELATEIAASAPLAVRSTRLSLRSGFAEQVREANRFERAMQLKQFASEDFKEGVLAMAQRRLPVFYGR
jgi:enoyl-CoA hydratase/carnithine racemase